MKRGILLSIIVVMLSASLMAQPSIPDPAGRWVVDDANVLTESTESTVSTLCQNEFNSTTNQVVVYTFPSLNGATIESYANEVYNKWQIGSKKENNGVLLIIAVDDHELRIETGYGIEAYLTDIECKDIIDYTITPEFKKGNFDDGVRKGVEKIIEGIKGNLPVTNQSSNFNYNGHQDWSVAGNIIGSVCIIIFLIAFFTVPTILFSRIKDDKISWRNFIITLVVFGFFQLNIFSKWYGILIFLLICGGTLFGFWKLRKYWKLKFGDNDKKWIIFNTTGGGGMFFGTKFTSTTGSGSSFRGRGGGGFSGGGFSGGGGSSGGGGASGKW